MPKRFLITLFIFLCAGCSQYGPEELDRLVKEDPEFRQMIAARDQSHAQVKLIKADLLGKKKIMDSQISKIHLDYDTYAKAQTLKIEKFKSVIETSRAQLNQEIQGSEAQLAAKEKELEGYEKTLQGMRTMLKDSKGITLSPAEKQKWEERILMLSEKMRPLTEEIQELKISIRLKKRKLSFLR